MAIITQDYFCPKIGMASEFRVMLPETASGTITDADSTLFLLSPEGESGLNWITSTKLKVLCDRYRTAAVLIPCLQGCYTDMALGYQFYQSLRYVREYIRTYLRGIPVDNRKMAIAGVSVGGTAAIRWAMDEPELFSAAASLSGMYSPEREPEGWFTEDRLENLYGDTQNRRSVWDSFIGDCLEVSSGRFYIFSSREDRDYDRAVEIAESIGSEAEFVSADGISDWKTWSDRLSDFMAWWKEETA